MEGGGGDGSVVLCNFDEFFLCWIVLVHFFFFLEFLLWGKILSCYVTIRALFEASKTMIALYETWDDEIDINQVVMGIEARSDPESLIQFARLD